MMNSRRRIWLGLALFLIGTLCVSAYLILEKEGAGREIDQPLEKGNIEVPVERTFTYADNSAFRQGIIDRWVNEKSLEWEGGEKVGLKSSRMVIACLLEGKRVDEMNRFLMKQKATGTAGSRWLLNPKGGYNFNTMACTPILYLFKDRPDLLYPETKAHLANNILTVEGAEFTRRVPYLPIQDSENHVLMAESSRYLKNQWLWAEGERSPEYDNANNGVGEGLLSFLEEIYTYGIYEFNSAPYLGYTYCSLLNLHEFADGSIKELAGKILDRINWQYALSSYQFKHFPPYRRRFGKAYKTNLDSDYHTVMLKVWASLYNDSLDIDISRGQHHALWAAMMSYRPPDKVMEWVLQKPNSYFVKIGYGYNSCGGIYSGARDYLLSAGGANQGKKSLIVPKPIVLFMDDEASELEETFHMYGPGEDFMDWNNTGVYMDFAITKGKVHIPKAKQPELTSEGWQVFPISEGIYLNVYSKKTLGMMAIVKANSAKESADKILKNNRDSGLYDTEFRHPNGNFIEYDLDTSKDKWVIEKVNNSAVERKFDQWPFFEGDIEGLS